MNGNINHWEQWQADCAQIGVPVPDAQVALFQRFYGLLIEANRTTNLTRITEPEDFLYRHLLDALALLPLIPPDASLADIGSGAGIPAIPLAIARPDLRITAVESVGKKCAFIQSVKESMDLSNLEVLNDRSEALGQKPEFREYFNVVTARAVATLPVLLELCLPLVTVGGQFLAMKGLSYEAELEASAHALKTLGGRLKEVHTFNHPRLEGSRVLVFEKVARTPRLYPRQPGTPAKNPL
ncbi:MAG TPA: 16S rRNA (guanine(527)-N(7))-methyltransferase RsmG [Coleofasciculaceae cyanobacterium]|jgi:16S rRNA (guanine527-N7)-methyltransferase